MAGDKVSILVSESTGFSEKAAESLGRAGNLILAELDRGTLLSAVKKADVVWVRLRHRIDAEVMAAAVRLKMIVTPTTGLNHIDVDEARRRGIQVLSLRGETEFLEDIRATAEHTMALIFSLLRRVPAAVAHVKNGNWNRDLFKGSELYGKTVGVVGYGRLGRLVARYLRGFETRVLATDPNVTTALVPTEVTLVGLKHLLQESDIVTLHVNLCDKTLGFFGREQFAAMKTGAWFVNTSRGEVVDETALLDALRSKQLAGAALDVLGGEHLKGIKDHPLVAYALANSNLIITPHIGGCTTESMEKTEYFLASRLLALLEKDTQPHQAL
jgi:D-3-phosphoglycerate dehydrogenase / 2-oxoglutarate reductase